MLEVVQSCPSLPSWTFIHGILIGQGSIFILVIIFLKYVVFEDPEIFRLKSLSKDKINLNNRSKKSTYLPPPIPSPHSTTSSILSKLSYDLPTHAPESLDWLNILNAQMLASYRNLILQSKTGNGGAKGLMEEILNRASGNESGGGGGGEGVDSEGDGAAGGGGGLIGVDRIKVGEVELGDKFPVLSNARVRPSSSEDGAVRIELDLDYTDHVSLSLSTSVLINFPRPRFAILPISLSLTLSRFSGTLTLELPHLSSQPTSLHPSTAPHPVLHFSLHPDFTLQLSITSLLGSRAKLQDIPKVEQLILGRIRGFIQDRVVWPGRVEVGLPGLLEEVIRDALNTADGEGEGIEGLEGEDWEWVEGSSLGGSEEGAPNADSDDGEGGYSPTLSRARPRFARTRKEEEEGEATLDLTADGGPSVYLRPKIRKRPIIHGTSGTGSGGRRSSTSSEGDALISPNLTLKNLNGTTTTTGIKNNLFSFPTNNHSPMLGFSPNSLPPSLPPTFNSNHSYSHPHLNTNGNGNGNPTLMPWELSRPPSPTESLPGFFRMENKKDSNRDELISGGGVVGNVSGINGKGIYANRSTSGASSGGGMRYRAGGVGI